MLSADGLVSIVFTLWVCECLCMCPRGKIRDVIQHELQQRGFWTIFYVFIQLSWDRWYHCFSTARANQKTLQLCGSDENGMPDSTTAGIILWLHLCGNMSDMVSGRIYKLHNSKLIITEIWENSGRQMSQAKSHLKQSAKKRLTINCWRGSDRSTEISCDHRYL